MVSQKQIDLIERKVPEGCKLPTGFKAFLAADIPVRVAWNGLEPYGFCKSAEQEMVPFIAIADGSIVALWYSVKPPAVVLIDGHGEPPQVLATDFPNFLRSISASKTGVSDIDLDCAEISIPRYNAKPSRAGRAALQRKLVQWSNNFSAMVEPSQSDKSDDLRVKIHQTVSKMIRDGLSKVYTPDHSWTMNLRIQRKRDGLKIEYLDYGKWYDVPKKYKFERHASDLLSLVKNSKPRKYDLAVTYYGLVSVDRDKQLLLMPPD